MNVACIILNYNDAENTISLINEIQGYSSLRHIIIVDNCSTDDSYERLVKFESDKIHIQKTNKNGGYGAGNNYGVKCALKYGCDYVLIANPDVHFSNDLVYAFSNFLDENSEYGVVSGIQLDKNGTEIMRTAWRIPTKWRYIFSTGSVLRRYGENYYYTRDELHISNIVSVDCVAGSLLMVSVPKFLNCGGYDEEMFLYCEETTLGSKMKAMSYKTAVISDVSYRHIHGVTIQKSISSNLKKKQILLQSHHLLLKKYLDANLFELLIDWSVGKVVLLEEIIKRIGKH